MFPRFALATAIALITGCCAAQGIVRGKISDTKGELVIGAAVVVKDKPGVGAMTDFDGTYSLKLPTGDPTTLTISAMGYESQEITVAVPSGGVVVRDIELGTKTLELGTKKITRRASHRNDTYLDKLKTNAAVSFDYISNDRMTKTGDADVTAAVKRVPGVSTVGRFVTVRGLADRYIVTSVNGSRIPTLDPFTNNISLDIFPTGLVDNLIINKTGSPEFPADWSGAYLSINTTDYPSKLAVNITSSFGYNPQTTWKPIVSSKGSDTDWLGYDDGYRGIPDGVAVDQADFPIYSANPGIYDQFALLGLEAYMNSFGITSSTPITEGDPYQLLGLVELGYLAPALFNDPAAGAAAVDAYNAAYGADHFRPLFNQELGEIGHKFNNDSWSTVEKTAPLNFSQSISIGNQVLLFKRPLGFIVGLRYARDTKYDAHSVAKRTNSSPDEVPVADIFNYRQQVSSEQAGWSALANVSYKLNENNSVSLLFMPNVQGQNDARNFRGSQADQSITEVLAGVDQTYEEKQQLIYQFRSAHYLPKSKLKVDLNASYTDGQMNILDYKTVTWFEDTVTGYRQFNSNAELPRRFRYMNEDLFDGRIGLEFPLMDVKGRPRKLMFGGAYRHDQRENVQVQYSVRGVAGSELVGTLAEYLADAHFEVASGSGFTYQNISSELDSDIGISEISAGYVMADYSLTERIRAVGGARAEQTDLLSDIRQYYDLGLPADDPDRRLIGGKKANPGAIEQLDVLPSINLIFKLKDDSLALMNLRANYFRSLGRPGFREISSVDLDDFILRGRVRGNPGLQMTYVNNYDLRLETYFPRGDNVTLSAFYKQFENHIELVKLPGGENFSWANARNSEAFGLELEGKMKLLRSLDLFGNFTFIESRTAVSITSPDNTSGDERSTTRSMFGQAPYIVNALLNLHLDSIGFEVSLSHNVQGPKLAVVATAGVGQPDVYELPRHLLDLTLSKSLGKRFVVRARVRDILNAPARRAYSFDSGYDLDFDRYTYGTEYILSLTFRI
ncbi:MAG: outer membrane beta-barrel protein [Flavobacteriales bacterium]